MALVYYYTANLLFQTALTILLVSLICRYNPKDHRSVIFQRLMYACLLWAGFDLLMVLNQKFLPHDTAFLVYTRLSFMFLLFAPLAIQMTLSLVRELRPAEKCLILVPYVALYIVILVFPELSNARTFGIEGGWQGAWPPWNTVFKFFSLGVPVFCIIFLLVRSAGDTDPVVRKEKQLLAKGAILFMTGIVLSQVLKSKWPELPWFANFFTSILSFSAYLSLKKYGRVLSGQTLFETTVNISPSGISHIRNMRMIWTNASMQALLRREAGPMADVRDIFHPEQPDGLDRETIIRELCQGTIKGRMVYVKNDSPRPQACLINCAPLEKGKPENGVLMILTDVSEENRIRNELKGLNRQLEKMAHRDSLTKIANRRRFDRVLEAEWQRAKRDCAPLSLVIVDVDYFKKYNDAYGHPEGDKVLQAVARQIRETLKRPGDLVCRIGGEEFGIILPQTPVDGGRVLAEKIRNQIQALNLVHEQSAAAPVITVSAGVAGIIDFEDLTPGVLIRQADQALYQAKEQGRNQVACFEKK